MGLFGLNLEKLEKKRDFKGLAKALKHDDTIIRRQVVDILINMDDDRQANALLVNALYDEDVTIKVKALEAIRHTEDPSAINPLLSMYQSKNPKLRNLAKDVLKEWGALPNSR